MPKIATIVSVAGAEQYFQFAEKSLPSFMRNNLASSLFVFTDQVGRIQKIGERFNNLSVINLKACFASNLSAIKSLINRSSDDTRTAQGIKAFGYEFKQINVAGLYPIVDSVLPQEYTHILKIDCDSYFVGMGYMEKVLAEVTNTGNAELFLVARDHPLMNHYSINQPGVGFCLWRRNSTFVKQYMDTFSGSEQLTILALKNKRKVRTVILNRPGYHFVYPFFRAKKTGRPFTKKDAQQFLPAYFHLHGTMALKSMNTLKGWLE